MHEFSPWCATAGLFFIFFLFSAPGFSQEEPAYEEISVFLYIPQIGVVESPAYIKGQDLYLSVSDIFNFLKIQNTPSPGYDTVKGYFINPQSVFIVNRTSGRIEYENQIFELKPGDLIRTENNLYLKLDYFGKVFGLDCSFNFRTLSVILNTKLELPIIREMKQELMRKNLRRLKGEMKPDTTIPRRYPFFHMGMADWSILTTQQLHGKEDAVVSLMLGSVLAGGEANVTFNFNQKLPFTEREQGYYWHFVNNDLNVFKQLTFGKISAQATSSLHGSLLGFQVTNTPTQYRRSFSTYRLSDHTEPGWIVELYVNNVLVDYVKADASGFFTFDVPMVYGNSSVKLRYYGPWGEERTREQAITVPFNFLPPGSVEYMFTAGIVEDTKNSQFSRANFNYGAGQRLTLGGGVEYLSSIKTGPTMPFANFSMRISSNVMMSGEYTYGVKGKGVLNYRLPSGLTLEADYIKYQKDQTAVINPYLEDRKVALSLPVRSRNFTAYLRFLIDQIILMRSKYFSTEFLISGSILGVSTNLTTYGLFSDPGRPNFNSTLSLGIRLPKRFVLTPEVQYDYVKNQFMSLKFGLEKSVFLHGVINLTYEYNFWGSNSNLQVGLRYDFSFAQTGIIANNNSGETTLGQSARGSLMFDRKTHYIGATNRSSVGRCGMVILPFLDLNGNGHHDADEPKVTGLNLHITGGQIELSKRDSTIRVFNLDPFISYFIEIDRSSFENVAWQIKKPMISVAVDPNQFKLVEVPVSVLGEVSGMVYLSEESGMTGQERIIVSFFRDDSVLVARTVSESDGYFTFLGLAPGLYSARIDPVQLQSLDMTSTPDRLLFGIKRTTEGDQVSGLEFVLRSLHADTAKKLTKVAENTVPSIKEQQLVPEKIKLPDSLKENKKELTNEKKEIVASIPAQKPLIKPVITDSAGPTEKITNKTVPETRAPEMKPVKTKQPNTIIVKLKKKIPDTIHTLPTVSSPQQSKKHGIADSCDFTLQTSRSFSLISALAAQKELSDTFGRPVMIISEKGSCTLCIDGFCGQKEAELFMQKIAGKGFDSAFIVRIRGYSIQVGAFRIRDYALTVQSRLASGTSNPIIIVFEDGYYKVRIAGFTRFNEAKKFIPQLNDQGFMDTYILKSH